MNNQAKDSSGSPVCAHAINLSTQWSCFPRQDGGWSIRKQTVHILQRKRLQVTLAQGHRHFISQDQTPQMVNWGGKPLNALHIRSSGRVLRWFTFPRRWQEGEIGLCVHGWRRDYSWNCRGASTISRRPRCSGLAQDQSLRISGVGAHAWTLLTI